MNIRTHARVCVCVRIILPGDVISFISTIKQNRDRENSSTYINLQNRMESIFRLLKWSTAGSMLFLIEKKGFYLILDTCQFDQEKKKMTSDSLRHTIKKNGKVFIIWMSTNIRYSFVSTRLTLFDGFGLF